MEMKWWNRFKQWVMLMVTGKQYFSGRDYGGKDETVVVFGYRDRKGIMHITSEHTINPTEVQRNFMAMGVSIQQFANAMGNMAKAFPSVEDIMKTTKLANDQIKNREGMFREARKEKELLQTRAICKPISGKISDAPIGPPKHEQARRCYQVPIKKGKKQ